MLRLIALLSQRARLLCATWVTRFRGTAWQRSDRKRDKANNRPSRPWRAQSFPQSLALLNDSYSASHCPFSNDAVYWKFHSATNQRKPIAALTQQEFLYIFEFVWSFARLQNGTWFRKKKSKKKKPKKKNQEHKDKDHGIKLADGRKVVIKDVKQEIEKERERERAQCTPRIKRIGKLKKRETNALVTVRRVDFATNSLSL